MNRARVWSVAVNRDDLVPLALLREDVVTAFNAIERKAKTLIEGDQVIEWKTVWNGSRHEPPTKLFRCWAPILSLHRGTAFKHYTIV